MRNRPNSFLNVLLILFLEAAPWLILYSVCKVECEDNSLLLKFIIVSMIVTGCVSLPFGIMEIYLNFRSFIENKCVDLDYAISEANMRAIVRHRKKLERKRQNDIRNKVSKMQ